MTTPTPINVELLDAMLSHSGATAPGVPSPRSQAESLFNSIAIPERAGGLLSLLLQLSQSPNPTNVGRRMLAAVLLRRDLSSLGGVALVKSPMTTPTTPTAALSLLKDMTEPLLSLFATEEKDAGGKQCRRQIGHCVAELCLSVSVLNGTDGDFVMKTVLGRLGPGCASADATSLRLMSNLADRAPLTLWRNGTAQDFMSLLQSAISSVQGQNVERIEPLLEAVCYIGHASDKAAKVGPSQLGVGMAELMQALQSQGAGDEEVKVHPTSTASQLGQVCLPLLLERIIASLQTSTNIDDDAYAKCMSHLSHAASQCPSLLAGDAATLGSLVQTCLTIARDNSHFEEATVRLAALEVLASITEISDVKKNLSSSLRNALLLGENVRDIKDQSGVIRICAELIVQGVDDDVDGWVGEPASLQDDANSWDGDDASIYAESLLESFLKNLGGGQQTLPVVLPLVESLLAASEWRNQRAGLSILEGCLNAAPVSFGQYVPVALEAALQLAGNVNPRVQYQGVQLLGALCHADTTNAAESMRGKHGGRVLESLSTLVKSPCTKVSAIASLGIVSYCRGGDGQPNSGVPINKSLVVPYLKHVLFALVTGPLSLDMTDGSKLNGGMVTVQVRAISAVACLADATEGDFAPFYHNVMPGLISCAYFGLDVRSNSVCLLPNSPKSLGHELSMLRGSAIESATIVGQAVSDTGDSLFRADAEKIMNLALPLLALAANDKSSPIVIPMDQILAACARIAAVMGEQYAPFVPTVLPHLLHRALEKADVSIVEGDEEGLKATQSGQYECDEEHGTESFTVSLPGMGLKKMVLNTTQMQEKALAARAVYEHANSLGVAFGPYSEECVRAFLPLVNFKYSSEVRSTSSQALAPVFDAACAFAVSENNVSPSQMNLPQQVFPSIIQAISKQLQDEDKEDAEILFALADSLSEICCSAFSHTNKGFRIASLSPADARSVVVGLTQIIVESIGRRSKFINLMQGSDGAAPTDDDKAEYEEILQGEADLLTPLVDSIGYTLKSLGATFSTIFEEVVGPAFAPFLMPNGTSDTRARFAAVCLYDDCVEHCGPAAAARFAPALVEGILIGIDDDANGNDMELKAVSVYGVAQIARHAPKPVLEPVITPIMNHLIQIAKEAELQTNGGAENNSIVENAVSAIASLALMEGAPFAGMFDQGMLIDTFLKNLPLREDDSEAQICHDGLCDLIESRTILLSPTVVKIIGETLALVSDGEEIATPATCARFTVILRTMQNTGASDDMKQMFLNLTPEAQMAINAAMEQRATACSGARLVTP